MESLYIFLTLLSSIGSKNNGWKKRIFIQKSTKLKESFKRLIWNKKIFKTWKSTKKSVILEEEASIFLLLIVEWPNILNFMVITVDVLSL